jgi:UDP-4-amino-4,6-dideoxy-N-acetyl-beta-L-altrosamine transaminase
MLPYGKQTISEEDIQAVVDTLKSDFITTGPKVDEFEQKVAEFADAKFAVAVSNGTAALHCAMYAIGIQPGDEVIVPTLTFAASANCILYQGGTPIFADICPDDLLIDPTDVAKKVTKKTKAIIAVDYAGQPCDYDALRQICDRHDLFLISDACHSIGSSYKGRKTGYIADITCFSFHPVKHITTGEGGMSLTDNAEFAKKMRAFRSHGITTDFRQREEKGAHYYEMTELGFNYRITDFQCALGISQLKKLPEWIKRRQEIAATYDAAFANIAEITPLRTSQDVSNAYHLYVIKLSEELDRDKVFCELRKNGIGVNVHYIPVHLHPYYKNKLKTDIGLCPVAEEAYTKIISIPMFPAMTDEDVEEVIKCVSSAVLS